jgi:hypothetical protein
LRKKEQLKLKEVAINDTMTEKTRILDRMYKAEDRNLEMEHTCEELSKQNRDVREQKDSSGRRWEFPQYP